MSEPKLISPMLDGCIMGEALSCHDGVRCCPAIREDTGEKFIVKIISIPASQVQLEALLLTGAYQNQDAALEYFEELAKDILRERNILNSLSRVEGFVPYLDVQVIPMDDGVGYEVYLLMPYNRSVARIFNSDPLTHLGVINMGLDLCAALAACRRAGYLYVDLKPENIFYTEDQGYRIGDLGFVSMSSLKYATLPEKYHSLYTAPEVVDAMAVLNPTVDIYALGLVLYQAYNGGTLPFRDHVPDEPLIPPLYADYEMAEIILKACAADPNERWQNPEQMGQALVSYMQRNSVNDTPIIPAPIDVSEPEEPEEEIEDFLPEEDPDAWMDEPEETAPQTEADAEPKPESGAEPETESDVQPDSQAEAEADTEPESEPDASPEAAEEDTQSDVSPELAFMDDLTADETAPSEESAADLQDTAVTEETSEMLAQADDLIAHVPPEPVVQPEPIDVPMPPPILPEPDPDEEKDADTEHSESPGETEAQEPSEAEGSAEKDAEADTSADEIKIAAPVRRKKRRNYRRLLCVLAVLCIIAGIGFCGWYYYNHYYLQNIDNLLIAGTEDMLTVKVVSDIDESLLTVICTDSYGNTNHSPVTAGVAVFRNLDPQTRYSIRVEIAGRHQLTGVTTESFTTDTQTNILSFTAGIGSEDGSVILNFTAESQKSDNWIITYGAEGIPEQQVSFTGNKVTITGLTIGAEYTFTLSSPDTPHITGNTQVTYTGSNIIYAQDLEITACGTGSLTAKWSAPEGAAVESWIVRCYNQSGYDVTITTSDTSYTFTELDHDTPCTVEVIASGMSQSVSTTICANPITIKDFSFIKSGPDSLRVHWNFTGKAPEGGWIVKYTIDNCPQKELTVTTNETALIPLPDADYKITIQAADGTVIFNDSTTYTSAKAPNFNAYKVTNKNMLFQMCLRPKADDWKWFNVPKDHYKTKFKAGEKAAFVVRMNRTYGSSRDAIHIKFVLRDSEGNLIRIDSTEQIWNKMWDRGYCELDLPFTPDKAGNYSLTIYFNGAYVTTQDFTVI